EKREPSACPKHADIPLPRLAAWTSPPLYTKARPFMSGAYHANNVGETCAMPRCRLSAPPLSLLWQIFRGHGISPQLTNNKSANSKIAIFIGSIFFALRDKSSAVPTTCDLLHKRRAHFVVEDRYLREG